MTPDLWELLEQLDAISPAPWNYRDERVEDAAGLKVAECGTVMETAFIAAVRNSLPSLLDSLSEKDRRIAEVEAENERLKSEERLLREHVLAVDGCTYHVGTKAYGALKSRAEKAEAQRDALNHAANEWADAFYNAVQWVKNLRDKIGDPEEALSNLAKCAAHGQKVWADAQALQATTISREGTSDV